MGYNITMEKRIIIILITTFLTLVIFWFLRNFYYRKLINLITENKIKEFEKAIDTFYCKVLLSKYVRYFLKLEVSFITNNHQNVLDILPQFENMFLTNKAKNSVFSKAFSYFVSIEDKEKARYYCDYINKNIKNNKVKSEVNRVCDTFVNDGYKYLEEMLMETEKMPEIYRGPNEYVISRMYQNKKDYKMAKEYSDLSKSHIMQLDKQLKQNHTKNE